jgi:periplasmic divalent cation tolerance protein
MKGRTGSTAIQVVTTTDSEAVAARLARMLVERRLAACVQIVGPVTSVYRWQGRIEEAREWQCLIKTREDLFEAVAAALRAVHPYECPEIVALPIDAGDPAYLDWLRGETIPS